MIYLDIYQTRGLRYLRKVRKPVNAYKLGCVVATPSFHWVEKLTAIGFELGGELVLLGLAVKIRGQFVPVRDNPPKIKYAQEP